MANNTNVEYVLSLKDLFSSGIKKATAETEKLNSTVGKVQSAFSRLDSVMAAIGGAYLVNEIVHTTASFEGLRNQLNFASGSVQQGGKDFEWIREKAQYLGLDLQTAAASFTKFSGAARGTALEGQGVRDVFEGVGMAATVMHLSADEANGTFMALQQMLSKGKVSAEELNGQLGERLPGALGIAARAMNMTQSELMKLMQNGQLMSADFLPKFAAQLKKEFSGGVETASHSITANLNRLKTAWTEVQLAIGESILPNLITKLVTGINWIIAKTKEWWVVISEAFSPFIEEVVFLKNEIFGLGKAFSWASIVRNILGVINKFLIVMQPLLHIAIQGFSILAKVVIGAANGIIGLVNSIGRLFGMKELKTISPLQNAINNTSSALGQNNYSKQDGLSKNTSTGGTNTSAVEHKGITQFNIDINKLIEKFEVNATTIKESAANVKEQVTQALLEAVNDFQLLATK